MADMPGSDDSLLERLNALKPSTVTLDPSSKSGHASGIEPTKPTSREDSLAERLKSLRNQSESKPRTSTPELTRKESVTVDPSSPDQTSHSQPPPASDSPVASGTKGAAPPVSVDETTDSADALFISDDQTLEELLADLESDQQWLDEVAAEEEEHRRVTALLEELGKASSTSPGPDHAETSNTKDGNGDEDSSDDDSEGKHMTREAEDILAKAVDEAEWEKANEPPRQQTRPDSPVHSRGTGSQDHAADTSTAAHSPSKNDPFDLPTVPSDLQDQPTDPVDLSQEDAEFAASIASRMAALKVDSTRTLPSAPDTAVDAFGLPEVPSFAPADRPAPGLVKRVGYTDEDQKTWCVVCLEDGTVRCRDCDRGDDVYCARCWREMHVGPSAGYVERGHRWEKFVRGR
ncbi:hypothetical protein GGR52DRAFT_272749 [Hypoxylon sp. FL1284]|nr:hypothetical protein GGR52DRAFT_272749 [Hypoxylon sp. FL1284]